MITTDGGVKVLDFGLAKMRGLSAGDDPAADLITVMHTEAGVVMGTRPYISPEQVQGVPLDHRTDIFSMGVVLHEMATGQRPFRGVSSADLFASILRDAAPLVTDVRADLPQELARVIDRCLTKDPRSRIQTAREVGSALRASARRGSAGRSAATTGDEAFWIAVMPFKCSVASPDLTALAEGLTDEIVAGLSRFSYLRVLTKGSSGARYVLEGNLRQAAGQLRVAVKLTDASTNANLWAENYTRPYSPEAVFEIQDSLAPPIVSTIAEMNGVLAHSMWVALRDRAPETLTPYEAMLRSFGFYQHLTLDEYQLALSVLKRAIHSAPDHSGCLAMLAIVYANGHVLGFGMEEKQADLSVSFARRAVAADSSNHFAHFALALAHVVRRDLPAFRTAAERALALNAMDGFQIGEIALWTSYSGDWERGRELMERAMALNPRHPSFLWYPLVHDAYRGRTIPALSTTPCV